jgi:hypothetical protein
MLGRTLAGVAGAVLVIAPATRAQGRRAITLPDTNGANFSIADSAKSLGSPRDYDAVLGHWHFRFQPRNPDGTFAEPFTGHWSFEKKPGGVMIDAWRPDDPSTPMDSALYVMRLFDPALKVWQFTAARRESGQLMPGKSWAADGNLYLIQLTQVGIMRIRYFAIEADRFLWRADLSIDNGKTWLRDSGTMEVTRIAK